MSVPYHNSEYQREPFVIKREEDETDEAEDDDDDNEEEDEDDVEEDLKSILYFHTKI